MFFIVFLGLPGQAGIYSYLKKKIRLDAPIHLTLIAENLFHEAPFYRKKLTGPGKGLWVRGTSINTPRLQDALSPDIEEEALSLMRDYCQYYLCPNYEENPNLRSLRLFGGHCAGSTADFIYQRRFRGKSLEQVRKSHRFGNTKRAVALQYALHAGARLEWMLSFLSKGKIQLQSSKRVHAEDESQFADSVFQYLLGPMLSDESAYLSFFFHGASVGHAVYVEKTVDGVWKLFDSNIGLIWLGSHEKEVRSSLSLYYRNYRQARSSTNGHVWVMLKRFS